MRGKRRFCARESALVAHDVHEIRGIAAIEHAEIRARPSAARTRAAGGSRPNERSRTRAGARLRRPPAVRCERLADDALRPARHLERRAAGECQQQDARRIHALDHELRDAMRQCVGLAGTGAGDDQQCRRREWPPVAASAEAGRLALRLVEPLQVGGRRHPAIVSTGCIYIQSPAVGDRRHMVRLCEANLGLAAPRLYSVLPGKDYLQCWWRHGRRRQFQEDLDGYRAR